MKILCSLVGNGTFETPFTSEITEDLNGIPHQIYHDNPNGICIVVVDEPAKMTPQTLGKLNAKFVAFDDRTPATGNLISRLLGKYPVDGSQTNERIIGDLLRTIAPVYKELKR